jgi:hypothetical protein
MPGSTSLFSEATMRLPVTTSVVAATFAILSASAVLGAGQTTVPQETYVRVEDKELKGLVYLYAEDIESTSGTPGFKQFNLHVVVGEYRAPLLGTKASLKPRDLDRLVVKAPGIWRTKFPVTRRSGETWKIYPPPFRELTVRVQQVVPVKGGTDYVVVEVTKPPSK